MQYKGIDVSKYQGNIDWAKVKASGIQFAILRGGYGRISTQKDIKFEQNYKNAKAVGMPVGVYHYSYATTVDRAKQEADFVLSYIAGKQFEYPIILDVEEKSQAKLGKAKLTEIIKAFCDKVAAKGYLVGIYTSKSWLDSYIDVSKLSSYDIWVAQWASACTYTGKYTMWQYTSGGSVPGISGRVDMDYSYKDYPEVVKSLGLNGFPKNSASQPIESGTQPAKKSVHEIAEEIIADKGNVKWGTTDTKPTRKERLEAAGYNYDEVQAEVNKILGVGQSKPKPAPAPAPAKPKPAPAPATKAKGEAIKLSKAKLYVSATAKTATKTISGTYYIYDGKPINGRYRVTTSKANCGKKPMGTYVTGWVAI